MTVALATFLCPTSNTKPSTKYMGALMDVSKLKELNWCKFVHAWLLIYIKKYQTEKAKQKRITSTLGGCIYQLCVRFLDFNDFGSISLPTSLPRICFWKGQTIKHLSDMLIGKEGLYGALQIKDEAETCYAEKDCEWASTAKNSNLRRAIENIVGNSLFEKVKEEIFLSYSENMKDENLSTCSKAKQLLLDTLHIISTKNNDSEETLKIESSQNDNTQNTAGHTSKETMIVDSNGMKTTRDFIDDEYQRRKRRKISSQHSASSKHNNAIARGAVEEQGEESAPKESQLPNAPTCVNKDEQFVTKQEPQMSTSLSYMLLPANLSKVLDSSQQGINSKEANAEHESAPLSGFQDGVIITKGPSKPGNDDGGEQSRVRTNISGPREGAIKNDTKSKKYRELNIDINLPAMDENKHTTDRNAKKTSLTSEDIQLQKEHGLQTEETGQGEQSIQPTQSYMSIECAQNSTTSTQIHKSNNLLPGNKGEDNIIDLTSLITTRATTTTWVHAKTWYSPMKYNNNNTPLNSSYQHKKVYSKAILIGKRLFEDNQNDLEEQGSKGEPIQIQDDSLVSPEVQILGETIFSH